MTPDGNAIVYCDGAFGTTNGKTAHGLVRRSKRYRIVAVIDARHAGEDAGQVLDGEATGLPIVATLTDAIELGKARGTPATHFVVGLAPDGGRLPAVGRETVRAALEAGLNVDCGLHDFLSDDDSLRGIAERNGVRIRDTRKPPPRSDLHFFTGKIDEVDSFRVALLGTDSAIGKRTTAWVLVDAYAQSGHTAELAGTGQTAWLQGAEYAIVLDSIVNDFVSGEIEHVIWRAWKERSPDVIVLEGQGSLMNPAYPGGFELLAAGRPHVVVLQHAPARKEYDGFPGFPLHPLPEQIRAIEMVSGRPVVAITVNHEDLPRDAIARACEDITRETGLPAHDVLVDGGAGLVESLRPHFERHSSVRSRA